MRIMPMQIPPWLWFRVAFGEFAATVNAHTNESRWPGATLPRQYGPTERSHLEDFTAPSLVALRLRALFGVGARAEVVRILLEHPAQDLAVSDFDAAFYTRRNVAEALEALRMGGLVEPLAGRGVRRYRLRRTSQLHAFVGSLAQFKPDWVAIFLLLQNLRSLASRTESLLLVVRAVEARKFVRERLVLLQRIGLEAPPAVTGESYWHSFENWAIEMARAFAAGETPAASIKPQLAGRCASL
jgi:DNA-binding transcriptional ArsR family regulator